jgi:hypothetical protein
MERRTDARASGDLPLADPLFEQLQQHDAPQ